MPTVINGTTGVSQVQDGVVTPSKIPNNTIDSTKLTDGTITNADISNTAAISGNKIISEFGNQLISSDFGGQLGRPSNFWGGTYYAIDGLGSVHSRGNFEVSITSNGYRSGFPFDQTTWTSLSAATGRTDLFPDGSGYKGAAQISLNPAGTIVFATDQNKLTGSSNNPTERMRINSNGDVILATASRLRLENTGDVSLASTNHTFQVGPTTGINLIIDNNEIMARNNGAASILYLNTDPTAGLVVVGSTAGFRAVNLAGTGTRSVGATSAGTLVIFTSDRRKKQNIVSISNSLDKVTRLNPVYFNWTDEELGTATNIGLIAQEVKEVVPELVFQNNDGMYGVHYEQIGPLLINAVKELKQQLDSALQRISELESK